MDSNLMQQLMQQMQGLTQVVQTLSTKVDHLEKQQQPATIDQVTKDERRTNREEMLLRQDAEKEQQEEEEEEEEEELQPEPALQQQQPQGEASYQALLDIQDDILNQEPVDSISQEMLKNLSENRLGPLNRSPPIRMQEDQLPDVQKTAYESQHNDFVNKMNQSLSISQNQDDEEEDQNEEEDEEEEVVEVVHQQFAKKVPKKQFQGQNINQQPSLPDADQNEQTTPTRSYKFDYSSEYSSEENSDFNWPPKKTNKKVSFNRNVQREDEDSDIQEYVPEDLVKPPPPTNEQIAQSNQNFNDLVVLNHYLLSYTQNEQTLGNVEIFNGDAPGSKEIHFYVPNWDATMAEAREFWNSPVKVKNENTQRKSQVARRGGRK